MEDRSSAEINRIWPEIEWIVDAGLRRKVLLCWQLALQQSSLNVGDLETMPFTLLVSGPRAKFMAHKRSVVHVAKRAAESMKRFLGDDLEIDMDVVVAGAILADVGKLIEYEKRDGEIVQRCRVGALRHTFSGVALAMQAGVPEPICHVIAAHSKEGDMIARSVEATIVHHSDLMTYRPYFSIGS